MKNNTSLIDAINYCRSIRVYNATKEIDSEIVKKCIQQATLAPNSNNIQLWKFHHVTSKNILTKLAVACLSQSAVTTTKEMVVIVVRKYLWKQRVKAHLRYLTQLFSVKPTNEYSGPEKFALNYCKKIRPFSYGEFLGIFGYVEYIISWLIGVFKPSYRQLRKSDMQVVVHKSASLVGQTFMLSMAAENYDTCPMEGFDSIRIKKALNLPSKSEINMVISCGIRKLEGGVYGERFRIPFKSIYKHW